MDGSLAIHLSGSTKLLDPLSDSAVATSLYSGLETSHTTYTKANYHSGREALSTFATKRRTSLPKEKPSYLQRPQPIQRSKPRAGDELAFRPSDLSPGELETVFGSRQNVASSALTSQFANRLLRVLHARRVKGTLDLELPPDVDTGLTDRNPIELALSYLRSRFPVDEDAAILGRIEKEGRLDEEKLKRAEELGLYKPQSGHFGAEKGENDDVYGKSFVEEVRKHNEAVEENEKMLEEEKKEEEAKLAEKLGPLAERQEQSVSTNRHYKGGPMWKWREYHAKRATSNLTLDSPEVKMSITQRLLPGALFTAVVLVACYLYSEYYVPPFPADRLAPDTKPATATLIALIQANIWIFLGWRAFPPAWRLFNKYFVLSVAYPYAFSLLGNTFSHQLTKHLLVNLIVLWFVGTRVHEDLGRATFLATYVSAGVFGSFASLTVNTMRNNMIMTSLGASGSVAGILGAWCVVNWDEKFTVRFMPEEWQKICHMAGRDLLAIFFVLEIIAATWFGTKTTKNDHAAHLGGYAIGSLAALYWKKQQLKQPAQRSKGGSRPGILDKWAGKNL